MSCTPSLQVATGQGLGLLQVEVYIQQRSGRLNLVSRLSRKGAS